MSEAEGGLRGGDVSLAGDDGFVQHGEEGGGEVGRVGFGEVQPLDGSLKGCGWWEGGNARCLLD